MVTNSTCIKCDVGGPFLVGPEPDSVAVIIFTNESGKPRISIEFPPDWERAPIVYWKPRISDVCELRHNGVGLAAELTITKINLERAIMSLKYPSNWIAYSKAKFEDHGRIIKPKSPKKLPR